MNNVKDKIVLITGGSEGYGKATAKLFHDNGAKVIIAARNQGKMDLAKNEIGDIDTLVLDVTSELDWRNAYNYVVEKYGHLDILINNAGGGIAIKEVIDYGFDEIDAIIKLNLNSVIYGCNVFAKLMKDRKTGTIINVSSGCARQCWPTWSVYAAAKAGVLNFSKGLYTELQNDGVRVTCLIPGAANTGFQKSCGISNNGGKLQASDMAESLLYIANLPQHVVVEDVTVWGIDQVIVPL